MSLSAAQKLALLPPPVRREWLAAGEEPYDCTAVGESYVKPGVEDVVFAFMRFESGLTAHMHLSWLDPHKMRKMTVVGREKMVVFDDMELERKVTIYEKSPWKRAETYGEWQTRSGDIYIPKISTAEPLRLECQHFLALIAGDGDPGFIHNGALAGLVAVCAGSDVMHPAGALVVGGGYIASEFACILNGLGVDVAQYYRGAQILRGFDDEARGHVANAMAAHGVAIHCGTDVERLERRAGGICAIATDGSEREFDLVLYATGRVPNVAGLGLDHLGVALGGKGEVLVDDWSQTSVPSIFAVGDVTDRINLTPVAIREGHAFADTVFRGVPTKADHELVASAVFTQPELGSVGLSEEAAAALGKTEIYTATFRPMKTLFAGRQDKVLMKLVVSVETRKVLGCHIVGPEAGEMIQLAAIAIKMGATKEDFDRTVAVHPTMSEELVTMRKPTRVV